MAADDRLLVTAELKRHALAGRVVLAAVKAALHSLRGPKRWKEVAALAGEVVQDRRTTFGE